MTLLFDGDISEHSCCIFVWSAAQSDSASMLPLECQYLNKSSLTAVAGHIPDYTKHFTVKRKPKSAALRADIIHKCKLLVSVLLTVVTLLTGRYKKSSRFSKM